MISWVVASHQPDVLADNLLRSLHLEPSDELLIERDAPSITIAYERGQAKATQPVICYVHHDVQVSDTMRLRSQLIEMTSGRGIVGLVGSRTPVMPWWHGDLLGSVAAPPRYGPLDYGPGGECVILDGLLLATRQQIRWDTDWPGWHGYDHDACMQMVARGLPNWCLSRGRELVYHNTPMSTLDGWDDAMARYRAKWEA